jgi:LytS/YehU family sensor histidine kinase
MLNQRIAELEQKALRSQMNPHFIFNSLNSIQQYVAERDITGANNFITDFSRLIRMTLDLSTNTFINLSDEIDYITTYLKVEKTRLENQFDYSVNIDKTLNLHEIHLPPLLLQPYVENSIRHGIKYKKENKGMINISVQKKEADILVSIEDNGIGREAAQQYKSKYHIQYQSKGMSINNDRIDVLNSYNDQKIKIAINDLYDEYNEPAGTRVDIYLRQQQS